MSRNIYNLLDENFELRLNLQMKDGNVITSITKNTHQNIVTGVIHYDYTVSGYGNMFDEASEEGTIYLPSRKALVQFLSTNC